MAAEFCTCGSLKVNGKCTNKRCTGGSRRGHPQPIKSKGWKIGNAFLDFNEPITYEEAVKRKQELDELLARRGESDGKKDNTV